MATEIGGRGHASAAIGVIRNGVHVPADEVARQAFIEEIAAGKVPIAAPAPVRLAIELHSPVQEHFMEYLTANRQTEPLEMVQPGVYTGKTLALCGAGPSLADAVLTGIKGVDEIFACNSAVPYLMDRGVKVTGAIGIDQTAGLVREWATTYDVPHFLASSCNPALVHHLQANGRRIQFFHSHVGVIPDGFKDELDYYCKAWPPGFMVGAGFTVISRFIGVAQWLGFERIDIYGADCAFGEEDVAHANGEVATEAYHNPLIMRGKILPDEREWRTRPDMLRDAVDLARRAQQSGGRIRLLGDTLPVALLGKNEAFLDLVCRSLKPGEPPPDPAAEAAAIAAALTPPPLS